MAERCREIDGIRGYAALIVLLCHMIATPFGHLEPVLNPSFLLLNGTLAVQIFFVLSGDALSAQFFATRDYGVVDRLLIKRYFRLTFLIFISSLCIYLVKILGWDMHLAAAQATGNSLLAAYLPQAPNFDAMLNYALVGVYTNYAFHSDAAFMSSLPTAYNPVFWSMAIELTGSLLIFMFLYIFPRLNNPIGVLLFLCGCFLLLFTSYAGFFFGLTLGYSRHRGWLRPWLENRHWQLLSTLIFLALLIASCFPINQLGRGAIVLLAAGMVFLFYTNRRFLQFFHSAFCQWLGAISFPLYAIHFAILISLTSTLILLAVAHQALTPLSMAGISALSIAASLATAFGLYKIEQPYLKSLNYLSLYVLTKRPSRP